MIKNFIPENIYQALIKKCNFNEINEIRIRENKPILIICNSKSYFLTKEGISSNLNQAIYGDSELINYIVYKASDYSIYSVNEQIKQGFITVCGGIRIGLCGEVVKDKNIKTIKNFSSLCIRIPHEIKNSSLNIFSHILNNTDLNNTLIISPPGAGKTTLLRDIIYQFSNHNYPYSIFIADERGEITGGQNSSLNLGNFCDSLCYHNKKDSLLMGIRSMAPDIIVTDEIGFEEDFGAIEYAVNCGVCVIASLHAKNIEDLKSKPEFKNILEKKYFKRIIVLSKKNGPGTIEGVYKENLTKIYGGAV